MSTEPTQVSEATPRYRAQAGAQDVPPGYKQTEVGMIPAEWDARPLRDDVSLLSGHHVLAQHCNTQGIGTPYLTGPADFPNGRVEQTKYTVRPTTLCAAGDILVTVKGSGSGTLVEADAEYCISRQLMAIRASTWNRRFLYYSLVQNASRVEAASTGLIPGLTRADILDQHLPVPRDPAEQRAIAQALSDVDGLLGALEALIAKKRAIKQAAMQQLLTGKTRLPGFSGEWGVRSLGSCLRRAPRYGLNAPAVPFDDNLPSYLRITDIGEDHRFKPSPRVSVHHHNATDFFLSVGDLVFARTGASVGKSYLYDPKDGPLVFAGFLVQVSPDPAILWPVFLSYYVQTKNYWDWVATTSARSGQPGVNGREYGSLLIPLPPQREQSAIAAVLSDMDAEIAALEARRDKTRAIKRGMMQQLLTGRVRLVEPSPEATPA